MTNAFIASDLGSTDARQTFSQSRYPHGEDDENAKEAGNERETPDGVHGSLS
jgi:hypothetical protein